MTTTLTVLVLWVALSLPVGLLVARRLATVDRGVDLRPARSGRT